MKKTVTIGIPAYQSEENIKSLLKSLLKQKQQKIIIEKILVYVDGATDKTVENAKSIKSKRIQVINATKNHGFAYALQTLINKSTSSIFVGLNDDIRLESTNVIEELAKPFIKNKSIGLVGGNIIALKPRTYTGRCIYTSYLVFESLRYKINKGKSDLTCDGKVFALSSEFAETLNLKKAGVGNVDIYLYYENLRQGRSYSFAKKAKILFRLPEAITDFQSQEVRSQVTRKLIKDQFGSLFISNHVFPKLLLIKSLLSVFLKFPLETLLFKLYIRSFLSKNRRFRSKWKLALTTKKLGFILSELGGFGTSL